MRPWRAMIGIVAVLAVPVTPISAVPVQALAYAPIDRPGPPLSVPVGVLAQSLSCTGDLTAAGPVPVLLVPGTWAVPREQYGWNYMRAFAALGWSYCTVTTPKYAMEDMQISGEFVVHAIRTMYQRAGRRIAILGGSQGGSLPRWALRFWPDTRSMVGEHVGLAPTNHGGQETFPEISYTEIYTHQDQFSTPASDDTGTSSLHGGGGRIVNVALQDICPVHFADHFKTVTYDAVGYALVIDALTHDGPADPARIDPAVCTQELPSAVDPVAFPATYLNGGVNVVIRQATAQRVDEEPPLRPYVMAA